jgi:hypothetical protein
MPLCGHCKRSESAQLDQLPHLVVAEIDGDPDTAINLPPHPEQLMLPIMEKAQDS